MKQAGAGWVRINFRLGACFSDWTSPACSTADGSTALEVYSQVVNNAVSNHLQVIGLLSNEIKHGAQTDWTANNVENNPKKDGNNAYIQGFASNAGTLAAYFKTRGVRTWELWNEPNAWAQNPSPGVFTGSSYIYPSNFAQLLAQ